MKTFEKPVVGQELFMVKFGYSNSDKPNHAMVTVTKVGRKYFYVVEEGREQYPEQFHIHNWRQKTEYRARYYLYSTKQEWVDECDVRDLETRIGEAFKYGKNVNKLPLAALQGIARIIEANTPK